MTPCRPPTGLHALAVPPNDDPSLDQSRLAVVRVVIFQPVPRDRTQDPLQSVWGSGGERTSISFGNTPRREADSQPVSQSVSQASSQSGIGQASRQADREAETHSLAFFQSRTTSTNSEEPQLHRSKQPSSGKTLAFRLKCCRFESRMAIAGTGALTHYSFHWALVRILLSTNF